MRVLQFRGGLDLAQKPLGPECGTEIRVQHLDRDIALVLEIVREVHGGHAAGTEFAGYAAALDHGRGEAIRAAHRAPSISSPLPTCAAAPARRNRES